MDADTSSVNRISLKKPLKLTENLIRGLEVPCASHSLCVLPVPPQQGFCYHPKCLANTIPCEEFKDTDIILLRIH